MRSKGEAWPEDKQDRYYLPLLNAFIEEVKGIHWSNASKASERLLRYLLGRQDYYKVVKENGTVLVQSFNILNTSFHIEKYLQRKKYSFVPSFFHPKEAASAALFYLS